MRRADGGCRRGDIASMKDESCVRPVLFRRFGPRESSDVPYGSVGGVDGKFPATGSRLTHQIGAPGFGLTRLVLLVLGIFSALHAEYSQRGALTRVGNMGLPRIAVKIRRSPDER